jgi:hypothetical protein
MEVHDPPNHTRYCELVCPSAAGRIEFLSFSPATCLHKLNFRVADHPRTGLSSLRVIAIVAMMTQVYRKIWDHLGSGKVQASRTATAWRAPKSGC